MTAPPSNQACLVLSAPAEPRAELIRGLLAALRAAGWDVTVLDGARAFAPPASPPPPDPGALRSLAQAWVPLPVDGRPPVTEPMDYPAPYHVYTWLKAHAFGLVMGDLAAAPLYYALSARRTGVAFAPTTFALLAEDTTICALDRNDAFFNDPLVLYRDFLERQCAAWADLLCVTDDALPAWMVKAGWAAAPTARLPEAVAANLPRPAERPLVARPSVSVCLTHYERPVYLRQAVTSLLNQTQRDFEVVLVDDGSVQPEALACLDALEPAFQERGWRIVRQPNAYLGAARNRGAREARGDYLLFMDDDDVAAAHQVATLAAAAQRTGADVVTSCFDGFSGDAPPAAAEEALFRFVPAGGPAACGVFTNCFGGANALIRRAAFEAVGGFTELRGVGAEDYELFARLALRDSPFAVVPDALFWYRVSAQGMRLATSDYRNLMRAQTPYREAMPASLAPLLRLLPGALARLRQEPGLRNDCAHWRGMAESMQASLSWRLTAPLRKVGAWLGRRG